MVSYHGMELRAGTDVFFTFSIRSDLNVLAKDVFGFDPSEFGYNISNDIFKITGSYQSLVRDTFNRWEEGLNINFEYTSATSKADIFIYFANGDGPGNTAGLWVPHDSNSNNILSGPNEGYSTILMDISDKIVFSKIFDHEVGHALGLDHDGTTGSIMNATYTGTQNILEQDIRAVAELYGFDTSGSTENDNFIGSSKSDRYLGGDGADTISGFNGNDTLFGNRGLDKIDGGAGDDLIFGGQNDGEPSGTPFVQRDGVEYIWGGTGNDTLVGNYGSDVLMGQTGNDFLIGGQGDDGLQGGLGDDLLMGNRGADIYYYNFFGEGFEGNDSIAGFSSQEDLISLTNSSIVSNEVTEDGIVIKISTGTTILLIGVFEFGASDFIV